MKKYILNPAYSLKMDGNRATLFSKDYYDMTDFQECNCFIHPFNAQLLTFFNGSDGLGEIELKVSEYFGISINNIKEILPKYIENKKPFTISYKNNWMYFPRNLIIDKNRTPNIAYSTYDIEDFPYIDEPDLDTVRTTYPLTANLLLTMKCYTDCIYCYANRKMKLESLMSLPQIISIIREAKKIGMDRIDINGGEVLLHPHYKEILTELITNGFMPFVSTKVPISKDIILNIKESGLKHIQISLDSVLPDTLSKMLNINGVKYKEDITNSLSALEKEDFEITIHSILTSYNSSIKEIELLLKYLSSFSHIKKLRFSPAGFSLYKRGEFDSFKTSDKFIDDLKKYISIVHTNYKFEISVSEGDVQDDYLLDVRKQNFNNRAFCTGNTKAMVILPDGRVTICEELYDHPKFIIGDLTKQSILEVWNSNEAINLFKLQAESLSSKSACKQCNELNHCRQGLGVCWKIVLMAYGNENWDFPDPRCPKAPAMYHNICLEKLKT